MSLLLFPLVHLAQPVFNYHMIEGKLTLCGRRRKVLMRRRRTAFCAFSLHSLLLRRQLLSPPDSSSGVMLDLSRPGLRGDYGWRGWHARLVSSCEACFHLAWPFIWQLKSWNALLIICLSTYIKCPARCVHIQHHMLTDLHTVIVKPSTKHFTF